MKTTPNILWLVWDCARTDHISAHGHVRQTTPMLDGLIKTGLDFRNAFSSAVWSLPGYPSLLSGSFPRQHGINEVGHTMDIGVQSIARSLKQAGYDTGCFSNNAWLSSKSELAADFDTFEQYWASASKSLGHKGRFLLAKARGFLAGEVDKGVRLTNQRLLHWVKTRGGQPFFAFAAYMETHRPYTLHRHTPQDFLSPEELRILAHYPKRNYEHDWWTRPEMASVLSNLEKQAIQLRYDVEMRFLDAQTGVLLKNLKQAGLLDNTIVVITADHGEMLGENGKYGHQYGMVEGLRRVPLVIWWSQHWQEGRRLDDIVQTVDIVPSLLKWCGVEAGNQNSQTCLLPESNGTGARSYALTDYPAPYLGLIERLFPGVDTHLINKGLTCASDLERKVLYTTRGEKLGYHLASDPAENQPMEIQSDPGFGFLVDKLEEYLQDRVQAPTSAPDDIPEELRNHLEALGYL